MLVGVRTGKKKKANRLGHGAFLATLGEDEDEGTRR